MKLEGNNLYARSYIFDIDGNLFTKPVSFDLQRGGEIASFVNRNIHELFDEGYEYVNKSSDKSFWRFRDFKDNDMFPRFVQEALDEKAYGPSLEKFKEALIYGNLIGVNTARGHSSENLVRGIRLAINEILSSEEKKQMMHTLANKTLKNILSPSDEGDRNKLLDLYLSQGLFLSMQHSDFTSRHPDIDFSKVATANKKIIGMHDIIETVHENLQNLNPGREIQHSIGFSDDEKGNIDSIRAWAETQKEDWEKKGIHFVIYDTTELVKHTITDKDISHDTK